MKQSNIKLSLSGLSLSAKIKRYFITLSIALPAVYMLLPSTITAVAAGTPADYHPESVIHRNVMYYGDWTAEGNIYPSHIPAQELTHLSFAFLDFDASANLVLVDFNVAMNAYLGISGATWGDANAGILSAMQLLRAKNPNLRIGVSLGGRLKSGDFSVVAANPGLRAKLVNNIVKFVKYTAMDYVDIAWEYPCDVRMPDLVENIHDEGTANATPLDKQHYVYLLQELRTALDGQGEELGKKYELSIAVPALKERLELGFDIPDMMELVDFVNIMSYDMNDDQGAIASHHTALYTNPADPYYNDGFSVDDSVNYLLEEGADPGKLVVGYGLHIRGWEHVDNDGAAVDGYGNPLPGLFGTIHLVPLFPPRPAMEEFYGDLGQLYARYPGLQYYWDDMAKAPYLYSAAENVFFTFDDVDSVTEKAEYIKANNLGGANSWMQSKNKESVSVGTIRDELAAVMKEELFGSSGLPGYHIGGTDIEAEVSIIPFTQNHQNFYNITISNPATTDETDHVLEIAEFHLETIKLPTLYIRTVSNATFSPVGNSSITVSNQNGYGVVNLATGYGSRFIFQSGSLSFQVKTSGPADIADIVGMEITQRIASDGPEISRQTILENMEPTITGADNVMIGLGTAFHPLQGVTATDQEDGAPPLLMRQLWECGPDRFEPGIADFHRQ